MDEPDRPATAGTPAPVHHPSTPSGEPRASLRHSVQDGCAHAVMLGVGEAYITPYAIFLGMGSLGLGILASLPVLLGSLSQLLTVPLMDRIRTRKRLVVRTALLQGASWIPLIVLPWLFPGRATWLVVLVVLCYHVAGSFIAPAWNSWMGDLVPAATRGDYFGRREQLRLGFQLVALLVGGGILVLTRRTVGEAFGFGTLFLVAAVARVISIRHLAAMHEPPYQGSEADERFSLLAFLRRSPTNSFGRLTLYVGLFTASTSLAGPFFTLFMLRDLGFDYLQFTVASATTVLVQSLVIRAWGRLGDRFGNRAILRICGFCIPMVPFLWLVSTRFEAILAWQVMAGLVWAGFNLATANFLFDAVSPPKRARCAAYHAILVHTGGFAGALLGGWLAPHLPSRLAILGWNLALVSNLQVLFLISGALRLGCSFALLRAIREVRPVEQFGGVLVRIGGLSPIRGIRVVLLHPFGAQDREEGE